MVKRFKHQERNEKFNIKFKFLLGFRGFALTNKILLRLLGVRSGFRPGAPDEFFINQNLCL